MTFIYNKFNLVVNLIVVVIFLSLNPLYGLFITTLISLSTKKVSYLLVGILYVLSFALMFTNQNFDIANTPPNASDLGAYLDIYHSIEDKRFTIIKVISNSITYGVHKESLWVLYSMLIGELTNYNDKIFIFTTYGIIFSLSAILAHLISDKGQYNPILILFSLIFVELALLYDSYNLWRIVIASFVCLIGLVIYNPDKNKYISRALIYSGGMIHLAIIPYIFAFEFYAFLVYRKMSIPKDGYYWLRILLLFFIIIVGIYLISPIILVKLKDVTGFWKNGVFYHLNPKAMLGSNDIFLYNQPFNISDYFKLLYFLVFSYVFFNWKYLKNYEVFGIMAFIVIKVVITFFNSFGILYVRAGLLPHFLLVFISSKGLYKLGSIISLKGLSKGSSIYIFVLVFVCLIFCIRIFKYNFDGLYFPLENIAKGDFINPTYGLIRSIIYFDPVFFTW
jgi:hypothetical protein